MQKSNRITFLFQILAVLLSLGSSLAFGATLIVDGSGAGDYVTIQDAIDAYTTVDGDTILVRDGTYTENLTINKRLTVMSERGSETTNVAAADPNSHIFTIAANNVTIKGFSIYGATGAGRAGIYVSTNANKSILAENRCGYDASHSNYVGIYLQGTGHVLSNNVCSNNTQGILLYGVSDSGVTGNTCIGNAVNIKVQYSGPNNTVSGNHLTTGNYGIWVSDSSVNVITDNVIELNGNGIQFSNASNNNTVAGNTCFDNTYGLYLSMSSSNLLSENTCTEGSYGIYLTGGGTNRIFDNVFSNNTRGVELYSSNTNIVRGNTISSNSYGMTGATSNTVYLNSFINNLYCAYTNDDFAHNRYSPAPLSYVYNGTTYTSYLGNYYSDHNLTDSDGDGVTDNPYRVLSSYGTRLIVDQYPLTNTNDHYLTLNEPSTLTITAPVDGNTFSLSDGPILLTAKAQDLEDGDISGLVTWTSNLDGPIISPALLSVGTHTLTASVIDSGGLTVTASITITVNTRANLPPTVTINSPADGASFSIDDGAITFTGTATDPEDGNISASIQWSSSISGPFTSPATLVAGTHTITASVTDSGGLVGSASITVTITPHVNVAPVVQITAPANGASFSIDNGPTTFTGTAVDPEDGNISARIQWSSSINGVFTSPAALSVGTHTIRASVTDSGGLMGSASITVTITPHVNVAPVVTITQPANGSTFSQDDGVITLTAHASDPEDGDISGAITWSSSLDGTVRSPAVLSVGTHLLTARVTDSGGLTGSASITVTITAHVNLAPVVHITAPANNSTFSETAGPITFTATATDPENGDISGGIQWSSSINGAFTSPAILSIGIHTITARAIDSGGLTGTDSITVRVIPSMYVAAVDVVKLNSGPDRYGRARIRIIDMNGAPVSNATVSGIWSGSAHDSDSVATGSDGWATVYSDPIRHGTLFSFCVNNVLKSGWAYDPGQNIESCGGN